MQTFDQLVNWLTEHEAALSAIAAITVIAGLFYGALRFVFAPILGWTTEITAKIVPGDATVVGEANAPEALHDTHFSLAVLLFDALSKNDNDEFLASACAARLPTPR